MGKLNFFEIKKKITQRTYRRVPVTEEIVGEPEDRL